jgi:hypothetical protein
MARHDQMLRQREHRPTSSPSRARALGFGSALKIVETVSGTLRCLRDARAPGVRCQFDRWPQRGDKWGQVLNLKQHIDAAPGPRGASVVPCACVHCWREASLGSDSRSWRTA